jgi:hypothetical protein
MGKLENLSKQERVVYAVTEMVKSWGIAGTRHYVNRTLLRMARMRKDEAMVRNYEEWLVVLDELEEAN